MIIIFLSFYHSDGRCIVFDILLLYVIGLVYFVNPSVSIPKTLPTDTIVIQVSDMNHPNDILAAAKIPLNRVRLPLSFQMFPQNMLTTTSPDNNKLWNQAQENSDLLVQAFVCPQETALPCSLQESKLQARGIAKLVRNLPGVLPEGVGIRTAAALPLQ
jgi:hypothetical protein